MREEFAMWSGNSNDVVLGWSLWSIVSPSAPLTGRLRPWRNLFCFLEKCILKGLK